ncbi:multi-beta-barrel domain surface protein OmpL47 [Leptospira koniambonensis]|uniref:multi-beta-barrel domain surface protein OmpL47 n=1 Tax=Leptospira koniambonensis TaxID=2484950 RepID=UPI003EBBC482
MNRNPLWVLLASMLVSSAIFAQSSPGTTTPPKSTTPKAETTKPSGTERESSTGEKPDLFINSQSSFEFNSKDEGSTVDYIEYKIGSGDYTKYVSSITLVREGLTKITYRAVDKAGNKEPEKHFNVLVDNTPPSTKITPSAALIVHENTNYATKTLTYSITAQDNLAGVQDIKISINGSEPKVYDGKPIQLEKAGVNTIKFSATDKSGNTSSDSVLAVTVDQEKPLVELFGSALVTVKDKIFVKSGNAFTIKASDTLSGIKQIFYKLDSGEWKSYADPVSVEAQGNHTIEAKSVDSVGNESEVKKIAFIVDTTPPETKIQKVDNKPSTPAPASKPASSSSASPSTEN